MDLEAAIRPISGHNSIVEKFLVTFHAYALVDNSFNCLVCAVHDEVGAGPR